MFLNFFDKLLGIKAVKHDFTQFYVIGCKEKFSSQTFDYSYLLAIRRNLKLL